MLGGGGDDILVFDATDGLAVEGGTGFDTLRVATNGASLDLTTINAAHFYGIYEGIEAIDLAAVGTALNLNKKDLLHLSETSNTVQVDGNADDAVTTADTGWGAGVDDANIAGYTTYTNGNAKLVVDSTIDRSGIQA
jgi:hypothetical protein